MSKIITLTVNPAIDKSTTVNGIRPDNKLRCSEPEYEPGGGGINVSKVISILGGTSRCIYLAGGHKGLDLYDMLRNLNMQQYKVPIMGQVRENFAVTDTSVNQQYRFGMPGPKVCEQEWKNCLRYLEELVRQDDFLVVSGSLSPGMPIDFYAKVSQIAKRKNAKLVLDSSGKPLLNGAKEGVYLLKPNLGELATLCSVDTISYTDLEKIAKDYLANNSCEVLVVSLGARGAMVVVDNTVEYVPAPIVHQKSTIGAGDSMVGGLVYMLAQGKSVSESVRFGVACGTAATLTEGTKLCTKQDAEKLYGWINNHARSSQEADLVTQAVT